MIERLKQVIQRVVLRASGEVKAPTAPHTSKAQGDAAEALALAHLQAHGLTLLARNFATPGRGGGELDLVMRERDGTCVFVEVRARQTQAAGGALASITPQKQRRIILAAKHYLAQHTAVARALPPCRFDVVTVQAGQVQWIKAAFEVGS